MTWNLWWRFGPWERRQPAIRDTLLEIDADVVLLQEVWAADGRDQAEELGQELGFSVARTVDPNGDPQSFGNAILSRWPIVDSEMIVLPGEDGNPSHRSALTAIIDTPAGHQAVTVTHLAWQYAAGPLRLLQLQAVVDLIVRHRSTDEAAPPPIVGGDFNAVPDSDEVRRLTGRSAPFHPGLVFTDCWEVVGSGPGYTWERDNPNAQDALWPRRRLDYIFVAWPRPKPLANPRSAWLAGQEERHGVVPSDHYAVVAELDDRQTLESV